MSISKFESWMWSYLGIIVEALPFLLIGAVLSALIQIYVSDELIKKIIPKNSIIAYFIAAISGILFPVCECAIVPITRSLIKKGLPIGVGITFMLAVPIVNPVVIMSTYYAFPNDINIVIYRTIGGVIGALIVGIIVGFIYDKKKNIEVLKSEEVTLYCDCCTFSNNYYISLKGKIKNLILNASNEFLNISVYFIFGALLSSIFVVFLQDSLINNMTSGKIVGIGIMMLLGFLLSLCSEADAFVAKGFMDNFGVAGVIAFLILGPMMDLKNLILSFGFFKKRFVLQSFLIICIVVFGICLAVV
ncbi:MAG: permease [Clostridium celatum]|uniref:permease n=1 Tax=Clostridium sp. TaxID=1506 RepID=UPI0025C0D11A|nr:permease [Clostridium sp.]MBS4956535.1 permease [Clostridium sp.]MDU4882952.1 permease [Clostridium celatum]MDU5261338.1 permease [Clostridium celatum]MDU7076147.1 permease [Clostridium celatum]